MTVKKTLSLKRPSAASNSEATAGAELPSATAAAPAGGGATIADRFKLDAPPPTKSGASTGTKVAVVAAVIALVIAGILAYTIYGHWEFLKGA